MFDWLRNTPLTAFQLYYKFLEIFSTSITLSMFPRQTRQRYDISVVAVNSNAAISRLLAFF